MKKRHSHKNIGSGLLIALMAASLLVTSCPAPSSAAGAAFNWQNVSVPGVTQPVKDLRAVSGDGSRVSAIFDGQSFIYSTANSGETWQSWSTPGVTGFVRLSESPSSSGLFYCLDTSDGVTRSLDGGATWSPPAPVGAQSNDISCSAGGTLVAATGDSVIPLPAYYSSDGVSWTPTTGPPPPPAPAQWSHVEGARTAPGVFYLSREAVPPAPLPLYRYFSVDDTWTLCGGLPATEIVTAITTVPYGSLLVGCDGSGSKSVYRSDDGGTSWSPSADGLPPGTVVNGIAVSNVAPYNAYLATDNGAFVSYDGGTTWRDISGGLPTLDLNCITASGGPGNTIYAGAANGGVYRLEGLPVITGINPPSGDIGDAVILSGESFGTGAGSHVTFCGVSLGPTAVDSWNAGQIKLKVPFGARSGEAVVVTPNGTSNPVVFSINEPAASTTWYLAEGCTGSEARGSFETWVLVQNPTDTTATAQIDYMTETRKISGPTLTLKPNSRQSVNVADTVRGEWSVSTMVTSQSQIIVERAMYWSQPGLARVAAHDSIGVTAPATTWYLAEGCTGSEARGSFETWILVQNPGGEEAKVRLTYMTPAGSKDGQVFTLPPNSRKTFNVADVLPDAWSISTKVTSDGPVIAERSMYWNTARTFRQAAHDSIGVTEPGTTWYLAEGCTGADSKQGGYETWVLVQNPGQAPAKVQLDYMLPTGPVTGQAATLPAGSRQTFEVSAIVPNEYNVSTKVTSDNPVIAERAVYWTSPLVFRDAATDSIGVGEAATTWYLAEGCTGQGPDGGFETWVLLMNPGNKTATAKLTFMTGGGPVTGPTVNLLPGTRTSINAADSVAGNWSVSTMVTSDRPVIAERSMYWDTPADFHQAAHDSIGVSR